MARQIPSRATFFLFLLFLFGFAVTVLALVDLHWNHWLFTPGAGQAVTKTSSGAIDSEWELS